MHRGASRAGAALFCLLVVQEPRARADEAREPFDQQVADAQRLYQARDYEGALAKLEAAYREKPAARLLFNMGMAHRKLGHLVQALDLFERYRDARAANDRNAPVERYIDELREQIARERATAGPPPAAAPPAPGLDLAGGATTRSAPAWSGRAEAASPSVLRRWWFWTAVAGVALAAGSAVFVLARRDGDKLACPGTVQVCGTAP